MTKDLENAVARLVGDCTCAVCRGDTVHVTAERGVKPLVEWLDRGLDLTGFSAADRVVGRATAFLYCLLGVKEVYAHVMSTPAIQVLEDHGIAHSCGREVPGIINRRGTGPCPFEAAVLEIQTAEAALEAIHAKMTLMGLR